MAVNELKPNFKSEYLTYLHEPTYPNLTQMGKNV